MNIEWGHQSIQIVSELKVLFVVSFFERIWKCETEKW